MYYFERERENLSANQIDFWQPTANLVGILPPSPMRCAMIFNLSKLNLTVYMFYETMFYLINGNRCMALVWYIQPFYINHYEYSMNLIKNCNLVKRDLSVTLKLTFVLRLLFSNLKYCVFNSSIVASYHTIKQF